jgi:hypothetical protein
MFSLWAKTIKQNTSEMMKEFDHSNDLYIATVSGARGSIIQLRQLGGINTRNFVDAVHGIIVKAYNCGTKDYTVYDDINSERAFY